MFRRLLTRSPRRSAATGLVALTALNGGAALAPSSSATLDGPSCPTSNLLSPFAFLFSSDTTAKAAAAAGPAVVHISVAQESLNSRKIGVTLQDGREFEGTVVNADFLSDIATVKIQSETPLPVARIGSSSKLRPGDKVIALGSPQALQNAITSGIVRCVNVDINMLLDQFLLNHNIFLI
ncbi:hypothetical protein BHE74_00055086 [Ensete ventricosum]|nr:hypothetical protein BHE74_00055086 [Ensete ventricosum]